MLYNDIAIDGLIKRAANEAAYEAVFTKQAAGGGLASFLSHGHKLGKLKALLSGLLKGKGGMSTWDKVRYGAMDLGEDALTGAKNLYGSAADLAGKGWGKISDLGKKGIDYAKAHPYAVGGGGAAGLAAGGGLAALASGGDDEGLAAALAEAGVDPSDIGGAGDGDIDFGELLDDNKFALGGGVGGAGLGALMGGDSTSGKLLGALLGGGAGAGLGHLADKYV